MLHVFYLQYYFTSSSSSNFFFFDVVVVHFSLVTFTCKKYYEKRFQKKQRCFFFVYSLCSKHFRKKKIDVNERERGKSIHTIFWEQPKKFHNLLVKRKEMFITAFSIRRIERKTEEREKKIRRQPKMGEQRNSLLIVFYTYNFLKDLPNLWLYLLFNSHRISLLLRFFFVIVYSICVSYRPL